jgi:hypothetical protein
VVARDGCDPRDTPASRRDLAFQYQLMNRLAALTGVALF